MANTTGLKLIKKAMQKVGILTKTENPSGDEANDALDMLNDLLSSLSNNSMLIYARKWETFTLIGGKTEYTIGPGQDFDTVRPIKVISAYSSIGSTNVPITCINDEVYADLVDPSIPGQSDWLNYDNGFPIGKIRFYPTAPSDYPFFLLSEKELPAFTLNDVVDLPPGWTRMLINNLAIEVAGDYDQPVPDTVSKIAAASMLEIKRAIMRARSFDCSPSRPYQGNVYTGWNY